MRGTSLYDTAAFQRRLWTPDMLGADLLAWWDLGDLRDIASASSAVTTWRDRSGRGKDLSGGGTSLTLGEKKITSSGSGRFLPPASFFGFSDAAFVARPGPATAALRTLWSYTSPFHQIGIKASSDDMYAYNGSVQTLGTTPWAPEIGIGYTKHASSDNVIWIARNGSATLQNSVGLAVTASSSFLNDNPAGSGTQPFGTLYEYVYMTEARPLHIRDRVTGYLAWKWDRLLGFDLVSKLPATHTHKKCPPLIGG